MRTDWQAILSSDAPPVAMARPVERFLECESQRLRHHADRLAVMCCDGTWHAQTHELLQSLDPVEWDWLAIAGGPAALCIQFASFREHHVARLQLGFLIKAHVTRRVALIAHDFCGQYESRHPNLTTAWMRDLQRRHLRIAQRNVLRWHPAVTVEAFLLRGEVDGSCWVEKVADAATR